MAGIRERFPWGRIEERYEIGEYHVARYIGNIDGRTGFHGWIDGKDTNTSWASLDEALIGMVTMKYLEVNHAHHAERCIGRIIGLYDEEQSAA